MIHFRDIDHTYYSPDNPGRKWQSITSVVGNLKPKFNAPESALKSSKNPRSKWYGKGTDAIISAWGTERNRSVELGKWYHNKREQELYSGQGNLLVHKPLYSDGNKVSIDQKLADGIYPEHIVYLESCNIAGQVDKLIIKNGHISIHDYKTNKEIKREGWKNWEGESKKLLSPVKHLDECEFNIYSLQLSLYAYIVQKHNPSMIVNDLIIEHIKFEESGTDDNGYPLYKTDDNGGFIIKDIEYIKVPYRKPEVISIINSLK